eukprot:756620-Hanusia_phi.AAC.3
MVAMRMSWNVACLVVLAAVTCQAGQVVDVDGGSKIFMMNTTNPFHPSKSLSFAHVLFVGFDLIYADTAGLRGYIAQDIAQLGRYYAKTKFGCITQCDSQDFNGIDGILGLGMPDAGEEWERRWVAADSGGTCSASLDPRASLLRYQIFTLVSTDEAAELHLGGYDPHAVTEDMKYFRTTSQAEYSVPVSSISMGGHEFLNFASAAQAKGRTSIPGILDSGTSCLVVPDSTLDGECSEKESFQRLTCRRSVSRVAIPKFEIPFHHWWLYPNNSPCIQSTPDGFEVTIEQPRRDVRSYASSDGASCKHPVIGLAPRNPDYNLVDAQVGRAFWQWEDCDDLAVLARERLQGLRGGKQFSTVFQDGAGDSCSLDFPS